MRSIPLNDAQREKLARKAAWRRADRAAHPGRDAKRKHENSAYQDREQRRNAQRHAAVWQLHPSYAEPVIIDGEADDDGHYYLFQAYSPALGLRTLRVQPPVRLGLFQVARFLWTLQKHVKNTLKKRAVFLYFAMGYDIAQQLYGSETQGVLTHEEAQAIWDMRSRRWGSVRGPDFRPEVLIQTANISVQNGRKQGHVLFHGESLRVIGRVAWQDMFSLSNKGLVATISDWAAYWTEEERAQYGPALEHVRAGKAARGKWAGAGYSAERIEQEYQLPELQLMHWYASRVIALCASLGLAPRSLAGPAPMARALMTKYGVTAHIKPAEYDSKEWQEGVLMREWIRPAMFGGNIQLCALGSFPALHTYDIISAYPHWIRQLPCMAHGEWRRLGAAQIAAANEQRDVHLYAIYAITWRCPKDWRWPPFPVRDAQHGIRYPLAGSGRYCSPEIAAFLDCYGDAVEYDITDGWQWVPTCSCGNPFADMIEQTFATRDKYKQAGKPEATVLKLALNSCYGVMAQTSGSYRQVDESGETTGYHTPKHGNLFAAACITSGCRADVLRMVHAAGDRAIGIMTDAILTAGPVGLGERPGLGGVEHSVRGPSIPIAPGVIASADGHDKLRGMPSGASWWADDTPMHSLYDAYLYGSLSDCSHIEARYDAFCNPYVAGSDPAQAGRFMPTVRLLDITDWAVMSKRDSLRAVLQEDGTRYVPPYPLTTVTQSQPYTRPMDMPTPDVPETSDPMVP